MTPACTSACSTSPRPIVPTPALLPPSMPAVTFGHSALPDPLRMLPPPCQASLCLCSGLAGQSLLSGPTPLQLRTVPSSLRLCLCPRTLQLDLSPPDPCHHLIRVPSLQLSGCVVGSSLHVIITSGHPHGGICDNISMAPPTAMPPWGTVSAVAWISDHLPLLKAIPWLVPPPAQPWTLFVHPSPIFLSSSKPPPSICWREVTPFGRVCTVTISLS